MTGPPTPPPSSATEIQDAARTTLPLATQTEAPATEASVSEPPPVAPATQLEQPQSTVPEQIAQRTSYELLFPSIADLARSGSLKDLIQVAERGDLSAEDDKNPTRLLLVAPLVLAYLISDELPPARHAFTRLPDALASLPLIQGLFKLLASVSERKYTHVYPRAEELIQFVQQPADPSGLLGPTLAGMLMAFVESFRKRTFALIGRAYTSLPLSLAQVYLGLTAEEVVNVAVPMGWEFHETTNILTPPKQAQGTSRFVGSTQSTLMALSLVADSVANLEA